MSLNYLGFFPKDMEPRASQIKLLKDIQSAFNSGKKYVICCAPTGSGKGVIAKAIANSSSHPSNNFKELINSYNAFRQDFTGAYNYEPDCIAEPPFGAFMLTITKSLQDQYQSLFPDIEILKGKTNYTCTVDENFTVDTAPCIITPKLKGQCWDGNSCPYYSQRNKALTSQSSTLNYKMFLALPDHVKRKEYIICDEASELENELISRFSVDINYDQLTKFGVKIKILIYEDVDKVREWLGDVFSSIESRIETLTNKILKKNNKSTKIDKYQLNYLQALQHSMEILSQQWGCCEFVIDRTSKKVNIAPLRTNYLSKYIFDYADKVLLMSATIIDHKNFAKSLGIIDYAYVEVESEFDASKSPIYLSTKYSLNHSNISTVFPRICEQIEQILEHHRGDKGIIHSHSFEITDILKQRIKNKRLLFRENDNTNESILDQHFTSKDPTVLVSPSLTHGVDLIGDKARFIIVCKAPYPSLGSKRIKRMFDQDKEWFTDKMLNTLVQSCGRGTRSLEDHCKTYVLDGNIANTIQREKKKLPKFFLDRIH